ncbi:MAG: hypothetical protein ACLGG7_01045 [Bacteriovoracia bacterium]
MAHDFHHRHTQVRKVDPDWPELLHLPHHVVPSIPWYHLRAATEDIRSSAPSLVTERHWCLTTMRESWAASSLEQVAPGQHRLTPRR